MTICPHAATAFPVKYKKDISGKKYGRLTAVEFDHKEKTNAVWKCRCDCGRILLVDFYKLIYGNTKSCGCLRKEFPNNLIHGFAREWKRHPLYSIWSSMRDRCNNPKNHAFHNYGGRGIKVCNRWDDFTKFKNDMGKRPRLHSLDRIDNNGNYEPSNCHWANRSQQMANCRINVNVKFRGEIKNLTEWSRITKIPRPCLRARLRRGWNIELALSKPSKKYV